MSDPAAESMAALIVNMTPEQRQAYGFGHSDVTVLCRHIDAQADQIKALKEGLRLALVEWEICSREVDCSGAYRKGEHEANAREIERLRKIVDP